MGSLNTLESLGRLGSLGKFGESGCDKPGWGYLNALPEFVVSGTVAAASSLALRC